MTKKTKNVEVLHDKISKSLHEGIPLEKHVPSDSSQKISKVHYSRSLGSVKIDYREFNSISHGWDDKTLVSEELPMYSLESSLNALRDVVILVSDLPLEWRNSLTVSGISIHEKNDENTYVIKAHREIIGNNKPLIVNTPGFTKDNLVELTRSKNLTIDDVLRVIEELCLQAKLYLAGERNQQALSFAGAKNEGREGETNRDEKEEDTAPNL